MGTGMLQRPAPIQNYHIAASTRVDTKAGSKSVSVGCPGMNTMIKEQMFLNYQFVPPVDKSTGEERNDMWVAPFWLVRESKDAKLVNMVLKYNYDGVGIYPVAVPYLTNNKAIKPGEDTFTHCMCTMSLCVHAHTS